MGKTIRVNGKTYRTKRAPGGGTMLTEASARRMKRESQRARQDRATRSRPMTDRDYAALMRDVPTKGKRTHQMSATARQGDGSGRVSDWARSPYYATPATIDARWADRRKTA